MNSKSHNYTVLSMALLCAAGTVAAQPEPSVKEFVRFNSFLEKTRTTGSAELNRPGSRVKDAGALEEMRLHILNMYQGVQVSHSFVMNSNHFDCVPVGQQPSVQALGLKSLASAPPQAPIGTPAGSTDGTSANPASQLNGQAQTDPFGNSVGCEQGAIPMRRITLEETSQYPTLHDFFQKGPDGAGRPAHARRNDVPAADPTSGHKYSIMSQRVDNLGGNSNLNLWSPYVNTSWGEVFSLSQEWYTGGSGAALQTAEVGWQNYPTKYGSQDSRLFIFWTSDNYATTGCYNLDCPGFVQVANTGILGAGFSNYSAYGGAQYEVSAQYLLYQGNWWLSIGGTWIGYYPGSLYQGGQMAQNAQQIEFGTEGVGTTVWPAEGSGNWSTANWQSAAYQRNLYYFNTYANPIWDTLTGYDPSPACYSTSGPFFDGTSSWGTYFYEGGPGGAGC